MLLSLCTTALVDDPHTGKPVNVGPIFDTMKQLDMDSITGFKKVLTTAIRQISLASEEQLPTGYNKAEILYNLYCLEDMFDSMHQHEAPA